MTDQGNVLVYFDFRPNEVKFFNDLSASGPTADHTFGNSSGHYFYTEVSGIASGSKARIMSPTYAQTSRVCKLQFYYWMEGSGIGECALDIKKEDIEVMLSKIL